MLFDWEVLVFVIVILISVVFLTLLERKLIGMKNLRVSSNWVLMMGIFQSIGDGVKLMSKILGLKLIQKEGEWEYLISLLMFVLLLLLLSVWEMYGGGFMFFEGGILWLCLVLGMFVYCYVFMSMYGGSKYSILTVFRVSVQVMSFELMFMFLLFVFIMFYQSLNVLCWGLSMNVGSGEMWLFMYIVIMTLMLESGRLPLDFFEGESELVSGFNVEYGSWWFMMIFLVEYGKMLLLMLLLLLLFQWSDKVLLCLVGGLMILFISVRGLLPRYRYDFMMNLGWKDWFFLILIFLVILLD